MGLFHAVGLFAGRWHITPNCFDMTNVKDIPLTPAEVVKYCAREHAMQKAVYPRQIEKGKLTQVQARLYWRIIKQLSDIAGLAGEKGLGWEDLMGAIQKIPSKTPTIFEGAKTEKTIDT